MGGTFDLIVFICIDCFLLVLFIVLIMLRRKLVRELNNQKKEESVRMPGPNDDSKHYSTVLVSHDLINDYGKANTQELKRKED